jgi:hypothetical protein
MKQISFIIIILLFTGCNNSNHNKTQVENRQFKDLAVKEQNSIIRRNVIAYFNANMTNLGIKNYFFLLEWSNKLVTSPDSAFKTLNIYRNNDSIFADVNIQLQSTSVSDFLDNDKLLGFIDNYDVNMLISKNNGNVVSCNYFTNYIKWSKGKIGERQSLGSKIVDYNDSTIFDFQRKYSSDIKLKAVQIFFNKEMKKRQKRFANQ